MNSSDSRPFHPRPIQPRMIIYTLYPIHECFMSPAREAAIDAMLVSTGGHVWTSRSWNGRW